MRTIKIIFVDKNLNIQQSISSIFNLFSIYDRNCLLFSNLKLDSLSSSIKIYNYNNINHFLGSVNNTLILDQTNLNSDYILALFDSLSLNGRIILILHNDFTNFYSHLLNYCKKFCIETCELNNLEDIDSLKVFFNDIGHLSPSITLVEPNNLSDEQQHISNYIESKILKHSNFIIWLNGNRGTGKSYTCSYIVDKIVNKGVICGGLFANINSIKYLYPTFSSNFINITTDNYNDYINSIDTLIIEEASSIPLAILSNILKAYKKIIIVSTNLGYEGSAKGLSVLLKEQFNIEEFTLTHRYRNFLDKAEEFLHSIFFYKQDNNNFIYSLTYKQDSNVNFSVYKFSDLLEKERIISYISELLQTYHYQQTLNDIIRWINSKNTFISIASLNTPNNIIGVAIFTIEYIDNIELFDDIYNGRRLPKNNLFPQVILSQIGIKYTSNYKFGRIERIVVHDYFRNKNIGSRLILETAKFLKSKSVDFVVAAFGIKLKTVNFWLKNNFSPIHISYHKDNASGLRSLFVIKSLDSRNDNYQSFVKKLAQLKKDTRVVFENINEEISNIKPFNDIVFLDSSVLNNYKKMLVDIENFFTKEEFLLFNLHIKNIIYSIAFHKHLVEISIFEIRYFYYICKYSNIINKDIIININILNECVSNFNFFKDIKQNRKQIISDIRIILQKLWLELYERNT